MKHLICRKGFGYVLVLRTGPLGNPKYDGRDVFLWKYPTWEQMEAKIVDAEKEYNTVCVCVGFVRPKI